MRPKILTFFVVGGVVVLAMISLLFFTNDKPDSVSQTPGAGNTLTISTSRGNVEVQDFSKNLVRQTVSSQTLVSTSQYDIVYFPKDKTFVITILSAQADVAREAAESKFLEILGIGKGNACKLFVALTVPYEVSEQLAGTDFGLSFCPSGRQF